MSKPELQTTPKNVSHMCEHIHGTTFATPDGKWLIHVGYQTENLERHHRDEFNPHHLDHYLYTTDKIHSVSIEAMP